MEVDATWTLSVQNVMTRNGSLAISVPRIIVNVAAGITSIDVKVRAVIEPIAMK